MTDISKAISIPGWMTELELQWLAQQASVHSVIAEIGSWRGRSTRAMADNTNGKIFAIDSWDDSAVGYPGWWTASEAASESSPSKTSRPNWLWDEFHAHIGQYIGTRVIPMRMFSAYAYEVFQRRGQKFDMVFIDGSHDYGHVRGDILMFSELLSAGGVLCGHDYNEPTCPEVAPAVHSVFPTVEVTERIWCVTQS